MRPALERRERRPSLPTTTPSTRSTRTARKTTAARPGRRSAGPWLWSAEVLQTLLKGGSGKIAGLQGVGAECDKAARIRWLQYHDHLSGMLPLAVGTRVVLADHLDRSKDKLLLGGSAGRVHSWVWEENDLRPTCVYVKFDGATWQLDGRLTGRRGRASTRSTPSARSGSWTPSARSRCSRYATTAHGSQGKTLQGALVDFNVDKRTDVTFGTVAASRVLILRRARENGAGERKAGRLRQALRALALHPRRAGGPGAPAETTAGGGGGLGRQRRPLRPARNAKM